MPLAPVAVGLEAIGGRTFAFYPPIARAASNEWYFSSFGWPDCRIVNAESRIEYQIPRTLLGDISFADRDPAIVVSLNRELEMQAGLIRIPPARVIEMPPAQPGADFPRALKSPASVVSIRTEASETGAGRRWNTRSLTAAVVLGVITIATITGIATQSRRTPPPVASEEWKQLRSDDDYWSIVARLGVPARERSFEGNGRALRLLMYPSLRFSVLLDGTDRASQHYLRSFDVLGRALKQDQPESGAWR